MPGLRILVETMPDEPGRHNAYRPASPVECQAVALNR